MMLVIHRVEADSVHESSLSLFHGGLLALGSSGVSIDSYVQLTADTAESLANALLVWAAEERKL